MKKTLFFLIIIIVFINKLFPQECILYNNSGKLRIDSTYAVDANFLKDYQEFEEALLRDLYSRIKYPDIAWDNNIQGTLILKITKDFSKDKIFLVEVSKAIDPFIDKHVLEIIDERKDVFLFFLRNHEKMTFYLPFKFEIEDVFYENLQKNKSLTIRKKIDNDNYYRRIQIVTSNRNKKSCLQ